MFYARSIISSISLLPTFNKDYSSKILTSSLEKNKTQTKQVVEGKVLN